MRGVMIIPNIIFRIENHVVAVVTLSNKVVAQ
jgi:hypothetical protein